MSIRHPGSPEGVLAALLGLFLGGAAGLAQDAPASPAGGSTVATMQKTRQVAHPDHIDSGTGEQLGDVVFPLSNVGVRASSDGTPTAGGQVAGAQDVVPAYLSVTQLDVSLDEVLTAPHATNVHESEQNIGN